MDSKTGYLPSIFPVPEDKAPSQELDNGGQGEAGDTTRATGKKNKKKGPPSKRSVTLPEVGNALNGFTRLEAPMPTRPHSRFQTLVRELQDAHDAELLSARTECSRLRAEVASLRRSGEAGGNGKEDARERRPSGGAEEAPRVPPEAPRMLAPRSCSRAAAPAAFVALDGPGPMVGTQVASSHGPLPHAIEVNHHAEARQPSLNTLVTEDESIADHSMDEDKLARKTARLLTSSKRFRMLGVWANDSKNNFSKQKLKLGRTRSFFSVRVQRDDETQLIIGTTCFQRFLMHPGSLKRLAWDLMSMSLLAYDIIMIPFLDAFTPPTNDYLRAMTWYTMIFWTLDMGASLLTGYQDGTHTVVEPRRILKRYLKTWFVLDVFIVGLDWSLTMLGEGDSGSAARLGRSLRTLRFVRTLRLIRLLKVKRILQEIQDQINTEALSICFGISKIILVLVLANHIVACCWYGLGLVGTEDPGLSSWVITHEMTDKSIIYRYVTSLHWSLTQFTPASMEVVPENVHERVYSVVVLLFAMITFSSFVSILTASMAELRNISSDETRQFWLLRRYLRDWSVSRHTAVRIQRYLEYAYNKQRQRVQARDVKLLALLTGPLADELKFETLSMHLVCHPLFLRVDSSIRVFSKALTEVNLARGDHVFCGGEQASSMTFTVSGVLQYHLDQYDEEDYYNTVNVTEGQYVCEAVLWTTWLHLGDLQALVESQTIGVNAEKFGEAVQTFKPLWLAVRRYADRFVNELNNIEREDLTDMLHTLLSPQDMVDDSDFIRTSSDGGSQQDENSDDAALSQWRPSWCRCSWWRRSRVATRRSKVLGLPS